MTSKEATTIPTLADNPVAAGTELVPYTYIPVRPAFGWRDAAACVGEDPTDFTQEDRRGRPRKDGVMIDPHAYARSICSSCAVRLECLAAGMFGEEYGIWGGLTRGERTNLAEILDDKGLTVLVPPSESFTNSKGRPTTSMAKVRYARIAELALPESLGTRLHTEAQKPKAIPEQKLASGSVANTPTETSNTRSPTDIQTMIIDAIAESGGRMVEETMGVVRSLAARSGIPVSEVAGQVFSLMAERKVVTQSANDGSGLITSLQIA